MKTIGFLLLALLVTTAASRAQVSVVVELSDQDFLVGEDIIAKVRIANTSGQKLLLGDSDDWLTFTLESRDGYIVEKLHNVPVRGEFTLETAEGAIKRVNLTPSYAIGRTGRYQVTANLKIDQWGGRMWPSPPVSFSIVTGAAISETDFGVPRNDGPPEMRRYALVKSARADRVTLYFRLSEAVGGRIIRTYQIGSLVSFSKPEILLDRASNFHVMYQSGARTFLYFAANPEGFLIRRELHEIAEARPKLITQDDGEVAVLGGVRRPTREDYPPYKEPEPQPVVSEFPQAPPVPQPPQAP